MKNSLGDFRNTLTACQNIGAMGLPHPSSVPTVVLARRIRRMFLNLLCQAVYIICGGLQHTWQIFPSSSSYQPPTGRLGGAKVQWYQVSTFASNDPCTDSSRFLFQGNGNLRRNSFSLANTIMNVLKTKQLAIGVQICQ